MTELPKKTHFAIMFEARSGSSLLVSLLNCSSEICCLPEIFVNHDIESGDEVMTAFLEHDPRLFALSPWALEAGFGVTEDRLSAKIVGCKFKYYDLPQLDASIARFREADVKLIYLKRDNILEQALSAVMAFKLYRQHGVFNAATATQIVGRSTINPETLIAWGSMFLATRTATDHFYNAYPGDKTIVTYENLINDQVSVIASLAEFLGVAPFAARTSFRKNTRPLPEAIENLEDIRGLIAETRLGRWLPAIPSK